MASSALGGIYKKFYDWVCGRHPNQRPWHFQWLAVVNLHKRLRELLPELKGRVLDVGCGEKPYKSWFGRQAEYVGLDVTDTADAEYIVRPDENWPLEDLSFDAVISNQALEHVEYLDHTLNEMDRVLKPNGVMLLSFPFLYNEHGTPWDFRRFTKYAAAGLIKGYEVRILETQGGIGSTLGLLFLNWFEETSNRNRNVRVIKGLLLPVWIIMGAAVNILSWLLDWLDNTDAYYNNIIVLLKKPGDNS